MIKNIGKLTLLLVLILTANIVLAYAVTGSEEDLSLTAWGNDYYGQCDVPYEVTGNYVSIIDITARSRHSIVIYTDNL